MNDEKFVKNWFRSQNGEDVDAGYADTLATSSDPARHYWHGVRDRMYRSGDLGRYDTEGGVECIGKQASILCVYTLKFTSPSRTSR